MVKISVYFREKEVRSLLAYFCSNPLSVITIGDLVIWLNQLTCHAWLPYLGQGQRFVEIKWLLCDLISYEFISFKYLIGCQRAVQEFKTSLIFHVSSHELSFQYQGRGINEKCIVVGKAYGVQESLVLVLSLLPVSLPSDKSVNLSRLQLSPMSNEKVGLDHHFPTCTSEQKSTHLSSKCGLYLKILYNLHPCILA